MTTTQTIPAVTKTDFLNAADRAIAAKPEMASKLSPAQHAVLRRLLAGHSEPEIAAALARSVHTVHDHTKVIYRNLGVTGRAELILTFFVEP